MNGAKSLFAVGLALGSVAVQAETYWAKAAASGAKPPNCFKWYADEAGTEEVTVTPTKDDGNTYVILGASKMTGTYTAPAGTTWIIGADGQTVGTKNARASLSTNGGITLNFGECTVYGVDFRPNSSGSLTWKGTNTLIACGQAFSATVQNAESATPRGMSLGGKFISDTDVTFAFTRYGSVNGSRSNYVMSGDFTDYKGKITASNGKGDMDKIAWLKMSADSAFGDPSVACTDYLTLNSFATLEVAPNVTQYATKGIKLNLTATQTNFLYAAEATPWTLTAPLTGTVGTLAKTGDGALTLSTSVQIGSISVKEGTLVIDSAASFAPGTQMYVWPGAQVVSRVGLNIPNVTVTVAEGGGFSFDFTAPYDGTAVTMLDMSTLPASDWEALSKPVPVQLSQAIAQPFAETNRFAFAKFPSALGITVDDFRDATPKTYGLPTTWFEVESDGNGCDVLYLLARPVVHLAVDNNDLGFYPRLLQATQVQTAEKGGATLDTWSDGCAPHAGADYVVANDARVVTADNWKGKGSACDFPGESLTFMNGSISSKTEFNRFKRLVLHDGVVFAANGFGTGDTRHVLEGCLELPSGTVSFNGTKGGTGNSPHRSHIEIAAKVTGTAVLLFAGDSNGFSPRFSGDGSEFEGTVKTGFSGVRTALEVSDIKSLVADRAVADPRAIYLYNTNDGLKITEDTTLEGVNYGIAFANAGGFFEVDEGKTFTLDSTLRFQTSQVSKYGAGTVALGGTILYTYYGIDNPDNYAWGSFLCTLSIYDGWVAPSAWQNGASYRFLRFKACSETAGIAVDLQTTDPHIAKYGMRLNKADAIQFDTGVEKLCVKILFPEAGQQIAQSASYPVLTVQDALAATLEGKITVLKNFTMGTASVTSAPADGLSGYTTFSVKIEPNGMMILFR